MFIQLDCGCIGLLIEDEFGSKEFYKIIDCRREDNSISFCNDSESIDYHRYRKLNNHELHAIVQLIAQSMADGERYDQVQSALGIMGSYSQQKRRETQLKWDQVCKDHLTYTSFDKTDIPKAFPLDDRIQSEKQKEIDYINRHSK